MKYYLVCNPGSRSGRSQALAKTYRRLLEARGANFECGCTGERADAVSLTRTAVAAGFDAVVAVGGDGTINQVLNGLLAGGDTAAKNPRAGAALGVLYAGTSPDFCRFHGIPVEPHEAVERLLGGSARPIDVCRMNLFDGGGAARQMYFGCTANLGLGPGIASRANRYRRFLGDFSGTLLATVATAAGHRRGRYELVVDGQSVCLDGVLNVTVGKNPFLASGLKAAADIGPADGKLFAVAIGGMSAVRFISLLPAIYRGRFPPGEADGDCPPGADRQPASDGDGELQRRHYLLRMAQRVEIRRLDAPAEVECDGDPVGWAPVQISVCPGAVSLIGAGRSGV